MDHQEETPSPSTFRERMSSVLDAIAAACPSRDLDIKPGDTSEPTTLTEPLATNKERTRRGEDRSAHQRTHRSGRGDLRRPAPPTRRPDYVVNPSRWKKYDLSDDGTKGLKKSGMSAEEVNRHAAFQFLRDLRQQREEGGASDLNTSREEDKEGADKKVTFKKPTRKAREVGPGVDQQGAGSEGAGAGSGGVVAGSGGVHMMAEYVVGREEGGGRKGRKRKQLQVLGVAEDQEDKCDDGGRTIKKKPAIVSLSHLAEEEDEDNG